MGEGNDAFDLEVFLFILASDFLHAVKSHDMDLRLYFLSEGRRAVDFHRP
jgi:hypothetical protein